MLSFQKPGPWGVASGMETERETPQWSEKGQGVMEQEVTEDTQTYGTPNKSMREAQEPSHLDQVKHKEEGLRYRQMSTAQHSSKRCWRHVELSREESEGSDPNLSSEQLKTVLKSPESIVGVEGSIKE